MDFIVEELSPVKKSITVKASAAEVNASLDSALQFYRHDLAMPGFRKGKVPASIVERRFSEDMKARVIENYLGERLEAYLQEQNITPVSQPEYDGGQLSRGEEFSCKLIFDTMPTFDLPEYTGLSVEQEDVEVPESEVSDMIKRFLSNMAEENVVEEVRVPAEGEAVTLEFEGFENGEAIADVKGDNFNLILGEGQALPDFEALVYATKLGEENKGPVSFPEDYAHPGLKGKTIEMKIKLCALRSRTLPEFDDALATKMGQESAEKLKEAICDSLKGRRLQSVKAMAQQKLMDELLTKVDFPLPESMVKIREERILGDARVRMSNQQDMSMEERGEHAKALDETIETMRPEAHKDAELFTKIHILLTSIANKENISATAQEADMQLYQMAMQQGQDFKKVREAYTRSGLMDELRERIVADKAMNFIYEKANITTISGEKAGE